jgi:hypothetical protein
MSMSTHTNEGTNEPTNEERRAGDLLALEGALEVAAHAGASALMRVGKLPATAHRSAACRALAMVRTKLDEAGMWAAMAEYEIAEASGADEAKGDAPR